MIISFDDSIDTSTGFVDTDNFERTMDFKSFRSMFMDKLSKTSGLDINVHGAMFEKNKLWINFRTQKEMCFDETPEIFKFMVTASAVLVFPDEDVYTIPYGIFSKSVKQFKSMDYANECLNKWWRNTGNDELYNISERVSEEWDEDEYANERYDSFKENVEKDLIKIYTAFYRKCMEVITQALRDFGYTDYQID